MSEKYISWRKSSSSEPNMNCVEVGGSADGMVGVRDTKDRGGAVLEFSRAEWSAFVRGFLDVTVEVCG